MDQPKESSENQQRPEVRSDDPHLPHLHQHKITYHKLKKWLGDHFTTWPEDDIFWTVGGMTYRVPEEVWMNVLILGDEIEKGYNQKALMPVPIITLEQCSLVEPNN